MLIGDKKELEKKLYEIYRKKSIIYNITDIDSFMFKHFEESRTIQYNIEKFERIYSKVSKIKKRNKANYKMKKANQIEDEKHVFCFPVCSEKIESDGKKSYSLKGMVKFHHKADYLKWLELNKGKKIEKFSKYENNKDNPTPYESFTICGKPYANPHKLPVPKSKRGYYGGEDYIHNLSL